MNIFRVVQICVEKRRDLWKGGGASLLAGIIVAGVIIGWMFWFWLSVYYIPPGFRECGAIIP